MLPHYMAKVRGLGLRPGHKPSLPPAFLLLTKPAEFAEE